MSAPKIGDTVRASNPGGREVTGTVVGWELAGATYSTGWVTKVEWFAPSVVSEPRRYVGRFVYVAAVQS